MIVRLKKRSSRYADLSTGHDYPVIGVEADDLRLLNDIGQPYLYPAKLFRVIDAAMPDDWETERGEDGELYAYPRALNRVGFFEDYFDGDRRTIATFWTAVNATLAAAS